MKFIIKILFILLPHLMVYNLYGSDTIFVNHDFSIESYNTPKSNSKYYFINKFICSKNTNNNFIFSDFSLPDNNEIKSLIFRKCVFEDNQLNNQLKSSNIINGDFVFDRCFIRDLNLVNIKGYLEFYNTKCNNLNILNSNKVSINFVNVNSYKITIDNCTDLALEFTNHFNTESSKYITSNSNINLLKFDLIDKYGSFVYEFNNDTIKNIQFNNGQKEDIKNYKLESYANEIIFRKCHITKAIDFKSRAPNTKIKFIDCTFGPGFDLINLRVDCLALEDIKYSPSPLKINFAVDTIWGQISIVNMEVSHLQINWSDKVWVYFDSIQSPEVINRTFILLEDKYRAELKSDYYQKIDIMHHYYSEGDVFWNLDQYWWGHGYQKNMVFVWTILLLLLFTLFNFCYWPQMQSVYTLFPTQKSFSINFVPTSKSFFASFLYSSFIFFSISIKLEKLKLENTKFVTFFLIQYLAGLFTLLFIIKAVLKW